MAPNYNLILAMESEHIAQVRQSLRGPREDNAVWAMAGQKEIRDPYRKSQNTLEHVYGSVGARQSGMGEAPEPVI
ncbi:hypothetical protein ACLK1S_06145 [Escherichia coli]